MPLEFRESAWPERWSSETLRAERNAHIALNKLSLFAREMECSLITPENSLFKPDWLQYWGDGPGDEQLPPVHEMSCVLVIDPVPPPSESQIAAGLARKDFEALGVVGRRGGKYYVCEISRNRGHEPDWTVSEFFRLAFKWRVKRVIVESVAYQRVLVWLLKSAMQRVGKYFVIEPFVDKRKKPTRISQGITGVASNKMLFVNQRESGEFIAQFGQYPNVDHDDDLEVVAIGCETLQFGMIGDGEDARSYVDDESEYEKLTYAGGAP
jgi:predicted phage terminase large subunit-like protein